MVKWNKQAFFLQRLANISKAQGLCLGKGACRLSLFVGAGKVGKDALQAQTGKMGQPQDGLRALQNFRFGKSGKSHPMHARIHGNMHPQRSKSPLLRRHGKRHGVGITDHGCDQIIFHQQGNVVGADGTQDQHVGRS